MNYTRLDDHKEYSVAQLPAFFVGNISAINIIVGANNTRKSRFLRNIANQDANIIISGLENLNSEFFNSKQLFQDLNEQELNVKLAHLQFRNPLIPNDKFKAVKEFMGTNGQVDFLDLKTHIENINGTIIKAVSEQQFELLKTEIKNTYSISEFLVSIYKNAVEFGCLFVQAPNFSQSSYEGIFYLIEGPTNQTVIPDCAQKLSRLESIKDYLSFIKKLDFEVYSQSRVYIPVLRTSRMISGLKGDFFGETLLKHHLPKPHSKLIIKTGLTMYEEIALARNGTRQQARDFTAFEKFIGSAFFRSEDVHIVAHQTAEAGERNIKISLPNELEDISIHDIGDGVQGIINLLLPIFTATNESWIFIDEPENHLHPGYQNLFMDTIANHETIKNKKLRFFINTHSNHILSGALMAPGSAEILVFSRINEKSSDIQAFNGNEYSTLEKLGVFNTSVLISNCSVWVEGVTDRFYLQAYLHAYVSSLETPHFKPIEGLHYTFVEYGGKNLIHYEFDHSYENEFDNAKNKMRAYFINTNIFLLADSDFDEDKHILLSGIKRVNFEYHKTDLPEIENLLPEKVLEDYLKNELKVTDAEIRKCFPLAQNVKLGAQFKDKFLRGKGFRKMEADSGGTLGAAYKKDLAEYVHKKLLDGTFTWNDLEQSKPLKEIIQALYRFISNKNGINADK